MASAEPTRSFDRAAVYRALARLFLPPTGASLILVRQELAELQRALARLELDDEVRALATAAAGALAETELWDLRDAYQRLFEASGGLACPPHETSVAPSTPQEGLTRTFEMADVAGFYWAFGVEVAPGGERPDHLAAELEFLQLLALKEAIAHDEPDGQEHAAICRDATRAFLRDHLGRWVQRFAERLERAGAGTPYATAGRLLERFVICDAARVDAT